MSDTAGEMSSGELGRAVARIEQNLEQFRTETRDGRHKLANEINALIGPIATLGIRMNVAEQNDERFDLKLKTLDDKVEAVVVRSAAISGGIGVLAVLAEFVPSWLRR